MAKHWYYASYYTSVPYIHSLLLYIESKDQLINVLAGEWIKSCSWLSMLINCKEALEREPTCNENPYIVTVHAWWVMFVHAVIAG